VISRVARKLTRTPILIIIKKVLNNVAPRLNNATHFNLIDALIELSELYNDAI